MKETDPDDLVHPSDLHNQSGLTKREYFAIRAQAALLSRADHVDEDSRKDIARNAVRHADALIEALNDGFLARR